MKQTQLIIAAINAIAHEPNLTHAVLDEHVSAIQQALGVETGDLAGVLLDLDTLAENDSWWRIRCMTEYIAHELRAMVDEEANPFTAGLEVYWQDPEGLTSRNVLLHECINDEEDVNVWRVVEVDGTGDFEALETELKIIE